MEAQQTEADLPKVSSIDYPAHAGEEKNPAVIIWLEPGDRAIQYVWDDGAGEILEETYHGGCVHDSLGVGGSREDLEEYALQTVAEYMDLREDPNALESDWPHVYDLATF